MFHGPVLSKINSPDDFWHRQSMPDLREIHFSKLKHVYAEDDGHHLPIKFSCFGSNEKNV
jgi:hypothetical protein